MEPLLTHEILTDYQRRALDDDGHVLLPGYLTPAARVALTDALRDIQTQFESQEGNGPRHYAAEHNAHLASLIGHPQLLALVRSAIGPTIRFDHCVALNRHGGDGGAGWHSHDYADTRPELAFVRVFFYVNGFTAGDGGLKVVPGSHHWRDPRLTARSDDDLRTNWIADKVHPKTGQPLQIEGLDAPDGSVVIMHTHAAHAVTPRLPGSPTRWCVVYAYRNPGAPPSPARWITPAFENNPPPGAEGLMSVQ